MDARDEELMMAYKTDRDPEAMVELFRRHHRNLFCFLVRRTGNVSRAEDLAQEVFAALIGSAERYRPDGSFKAYLYRIAVNLSSKEWRTYKRAAPLPQEPVSQGPGPDERLAQKTAANAVRAALERLDPEQREAIVLREYQELSYTEISQALGVPVGTVKSRIARGKLALRAALAA
jgi:RNA polymerase sigma-70 factor (ECF subfamily)